MLPFKFQTTKRRVIFILLVLIILLYQQQVLIIITEGTTAIKKLIIMIAFVIYCQRNRLSTNLNASSSIRPIRDKDRTGVVVSSNGALTNLFEFNQITRGAN